MDQRHLRHAAAQRRLEARKVIDIAAALACPHRWAQGLTRHETITARPIGQQAGCVPRIAHRPEAPRR